MSINDKRLGGVWIGLIVALLSVSAFIRIPMYPMPITMQMFIVFLIPFVFGASISFYSVLTYIILGIGGLPIFSSGGGIGYFLMPTFGYLIGYLISVPIAGKICNIIKGLKGFVFAGAISLILIYACGVTGVYININFIQHKQVLFVDVFKSCVLVFIVPDLIKLIIAIAIAPYLIKVLNGIANRN